MKNVHRNSDMRDEALCLLGELVNGLRSKQCPPHVLRPATVLIHSYRCFNRGQKGVSHRCFCSLASVWLRAIHRNRVKNTFVVIQ